MFNDKELNTLKHLIKIYISDNQERLNRQHQRAKNTENKRGAVRRVYRDIERQENKIKELYILESKLWQIEAI